MVPTVSREAKVKTPISATGNKVLLPFALRQAQPERMRVKAREQGFTLTELMVVLVLLGILTSAIVFVLPDPRGRLIDEGEAFAARAQAAQEAAIVEMRDTVLWVSPTGYGFERYDGEDWTSMGRPPFQDRQWPDDMAISVAQQSGERARIVFDATGLNGPLDVTLARDANSVSVAIGADGTINVDG
jgi:general secretion pathway protein H